MTNLSPVNSTRRDAKSERLCREITERLPTMPAAMLAALTEIVIQEVERRAAQRHRAE